MAGAECRRGTAQSELQAGRWAGIDHFEGRGRSLGEDGSARSAIATAVAASRE